MTLCCVRFRFGVGIDERASVLPENSINFIRYCKLGLIPHD